MAKSVCLLIEIDPLHILPISGSVKSGGKKLGVALMCESLMSPSSAAQLTKRQEINSIGINMYCRFEIFRAIYENKSRLIKR